MSDPVGLFGTEFRCLLADYPWPERGAGKSKRGADRHYPVLEVEEGPRVIRSSGLWRPAPNAHLWFWATDNHLPGALWMIKELGFRYVRKFVWVKAESQGKLALGEQQIGLGQYARGSSELLLFAVRGRGQASDVWTGRRDVPDTFYARRGRHSEKPAESYELIEAVSRGPRVEFFARSERPGWLSWGNEVDAPKLPQGVACAS